MDELGIRVSTEGAQQSSTEIRQVGTAAQATGQQLDTLNSKTRDTSAAQKLAAESAKALSSSQREVAQTAQAAARDLMQGDYRGAAQNVGQLAISNTALRAAMLGAGGLIAGVVVGLGALAVAALQGAQEERALNDALILTGNSAGLVTGQIDRMATSVARNINGSVMASREVLASLTATGKFTAHSLGEVAEAAQLVARFTGQTSAQVSKNFESMGDDALKWAVKANESYHFLQIPTYEYIKQLQEQGRAQEAARVTSVALSNHLGGDLTRNLGSLEAGWKGVSEWAKDAWQSMMNVGKTGSAEDQVVNLTKRLEFLTKEKATAAPGDRSFDNAMAAVKQQLALVQADARQARTLADSEARRAQETAAYIKAAEEKKRGGAKGAMDRGPENDRRRDFKAAGLDTDFIEEWNRLSEVHKKYGQSVGELEAAQAKLLAQQPAMRQAAQEQAALDRADTQEREAKVRINEQYLATLERENDTQQRTNDRLREQAEQAGLTKEQIGYLKAARLDDTIAQEKANLAAAEGEGGNTRRIELMREHIQLLQDQQRLTREVTSKTKDADDRKAQEEASKKVGDDFRRDIKDGTIRGLEQGKSIFGAFGDSLGNVVKQRLYAAFADSVYKMFEPALNEVLSRIKLPGGGGGSGGGGFLDSIMSFFGGGSGPGVEAFEAAGEWAGVGMFHSGGMASAAAPQTRTVPTALFRGAQRFHGGGLASDERPVIVKRNEGIFTPEQMANLAPAGGGVAAPTINIYTPAGTKAETRTRQDGNGGLQIDVMISQVEDALADRVSAGTGSLAGAMESRYGVRTQVN